MTKCMSRTKMLSCVRLRRLPCSRSASSARLRSVMSIELPTNCTTSPAAFKTGWPTVRIYLTVPSGEGRGLQLHNPTFYRLLYWLPLATWLDPPDECAAAVFPKPTSPLLDRSHICDTIPPRDARRFLPLAARPNFPYARASALPPDNSRFAAASLPAVPRSGPRIVYPPRTSADPARGQ